MEIKGVRKIFRKVCLRDRNLWRYCEAANKRDKDFLAQVETFIEISKKYATQLKEIVESDGDTDSSAYIWEKLNQQKSVADQMLLKKVKTLIAQRNVMHKKLTAQRYKSDKKCGCARAWRYFMRMTAHVLFTGVVAAEFACTVLAALLIAPAVGVAIAAAIIPTLAAHHWTLSCVEESSTEYTKDMVDSMKSRNLDHIAKLQDMETNIQPVVDDIESLMSVVNITKIRRFLESIDELTETVSN